MECEKFGIHLVEVDNETFMMQREYKLPLFDEFGLIVHSKKHLITLSNLNLYMKILNVKEKFKDDVELTFIFAFMLSSVANQMPCKVDVNDGLKIALTYDTHDATIISDIIQEYKKHMCKN
jgi:hypothetical protein